MDETDDPKDLQAHDYLSFESSKEAYQQFENLSIDPFMQASQEHEECVEGCTGVHYCQPEYDHIESIMDALLDDKYNLSKEIAEQSAIIEGLLESQQYLQAMISSLVQRLHRESNM